MGMAKRKADFTGSLDGFVTDYFKKAKCERTSKLFQDNNGAPKESENVFERFIKYLKRKQTENINDDLGFEINFGAYKPKVKLPILSARKQLQTKKNSSEPKKENKIDIPKDFIKKIKKLGMNVDDAEVLYKTKIDWTAVYSTNKIYCTEQTCDYHTELTLGDQKLNEHLISVH